MKISTQGKATLGGLWMIAALVGCAEGPAPVPVVEAPAGRAGLALTVDTLADTDVSRMEYTVIGVDCSTGAPLEPAVMQTVVRDLEDLTLPGGNVGLENAPFDAGSEHLFADAFFWLAEGCYDVTVQPLQEDGSPSEDCAAASQQTIPVFDGQTTEVLLINQCSGEGSGGLDVISAINHAPQLDAVQYAPSKFTCEDTTTICVSASDPDSDPLRIDWAVVSGDAVISAVETTVTEAGLESCATFQLSGPGDYQVSVTVFDLGYDADGKLVPIEQLLEQQGQGLPSRDAALLPIHAMSSEACIDLCGCPEGFDLNAAGDACERSVSVEATFNGSLITICEGSNNANYGALGARFTGADPNDLTDDLEVLGDAFFGSGFNVNNNSRLHNVGIWGCDAAGNPSTAPVNEWVGFSRCVTVEEEGEYVIGLGADDVMRASIDGQVIFGPLIVDWINFRHWWMVPVRLTAGTHIFEMEALTSGGAAAFGAEIYGPFAPGSTADNATMAQLDYANTILWSTGDQLGNTFDLGTNTGYSCEDGLALNLCGEQALCTGVETAVCE